MLNKTMKTTITKERDQHRTTIPKKLLEQSKKGKGDVVNWDVKDGKLSAKVMSHKEFIEDVKHASSLPAKTCRALGPESDEDINMYANHSQENQGKSERNGIGGFESHNPDTQIKDALCEGDENE